jgi:hypothetical protein
MTSRIKAMLRAMVMNSWGATQQDKHGQMYVMRAMVASNCLAISKTRMGKVMKAMVMSKCLTTRQNKNGQGDEGNGMGQMASNSTRQEWTR